MKDILEEIVAYKRIEVAAQKEQTPPRKLYAEVERMIVEGVEKRGLSQALTENDYGIIAEFKRKSPSKGWIKEDGKPEEIPLAYEQNGAAALSILTDEKYFGGSLDFVRKARPLVNLPILRKDFITVLAEGAPAHSHGPRVGTRSPARTAFGARVGLRRPAR